MSSFRSLRARYPVEANDEGGTEMQRKRIEEERLRRLVIGGEIDARKRPRRTYSPSRAAIPGSRFPSRSSRKAPPPVDT